MRVPLDNFKRPLALARFLGTAGVGLALDLWSKYYAFGVLGKYDHDQRFYGSHVHPFIEGWLHFEVITNPGAVFGLWSGQRILFLLVSVAAIVSLFWLFASSGRQRGYQVIIGMLLGGVLGNLYDRLVYGEVRDMIHILPRWPNLFPWIFNIADVLLCTGVGLMVVHMLLFGEHGKKTPAVK